MKEPLKVNASKPELTVSSTEMEGAIKDAVEIALHEAVDEALTKASSEE